AVAAAANFSAAGKRGQEKSRHICPRNDRSASRVFETDNELRGRYVGSSIELPLKHRTALQARLLRVRALSFTESQLVGDIRRQISKTWENDREFRTESEIARATELVIEAKPRLRNARVRRAIAEAAEVCILDHVRHGGRNERRTVLAEE